MEIINTKYRSDELEFMDSFNLYADELKKFYRELGRVNQLLGGDKTTIDGVKKLLPKEKKTVHIADIGCGDGTLLRKVARWGRKNNLELKLTGIDLSSNAIKIAEELSSGFPEISYNSLDVLSKDFKKSNYDIITCCLTLHHFKTNELQTFVNNLEKQTHFGLVVNDLHRSKRAYYLFQIFSLFFMRNKIAKNDGLISIKKGFKRKELENFSVNLLSKNNRVKWCWAFRFQWIISDFVIK